MATIDELIRRLDAARAGLASLQPAIEAGAPWPLSGDFGTSPESSWGPPEALAHVAEMGPFWTGEIARVVAARGQPAPFGRVATDALRIGVLERDRTLPVGELLDRTDAALERFRRRLTALSAADVERRGIHPRLGEMSVAMIAERFVVEHLEEHVAQLRELVARPRR
ncbi:MAG TPA: DinB family protein [Candidatus Limnocylindrales bacterium]